MKSYPIVLVSVLLLTALFVTGLARGSSPAFPTFDAGTGLREDSSSNPAQAADERVAMDTPGATAAASGPATPPANPALPPPGSLPPSDTAAGSGGSSDSPSSNVTTNLIHLMVAHGLISKDEAAGLIKQAQQEALAARKPASAPPEPEASTASGGGSSLPEETAPDDTVHVAYVPEVVKNQIRDEVTQEVLKQQRDDREGPAVPVANNTWPAFRVHGDIRVRYDGNFFPDGNDNTGGLPNFNAINTGSPFDTSGANPRNFPAEYDVDQDRTRFRLRARFGTEIDFGDSFTAGLRAGTGQDNSPVTENQTLGAANQGQGGDFSKYQIWLDRAFIRYQYGAQPNKNVTVSIGRFDNPFYSTTMIWADDIGFDGLAVKGKYEVTEGLVPFAVGGAFPVFNTDLNFASNQPSKFSSEDKYLFAGQTGVNWQINPDFHATGAIANYYFKDVQGRLSDPYTPLSASDAGSTDDTRPSFAQNGNTYRPLRDIVANADNGNGTIDQFQYYGLASAFNEVALTGQIDYSHFDPFHLAVIGEVVRNTSFDQGAINQVAVNNRGADGAFAGGDMGYNVRVTAGQAQLNALGDWNVAAGYRYVESDAVIDGFTDSDFGGPLTGTNLQGYTLEANLALSKYIFTRLRFYSADAVAGPTYKNDLIQFDINAHF